MYLCIYLSYIDKLLTHILKKLTTFRFERYHFGSKSYFYFWRNLNLKVTLSSFPWARPRLVSKLDYGISLYFEVHRSDTDLSANDAITAVKVFPVHVHGTAFATNHATDSTGEFGEHLQRFGAHQVCPTVHAVRWYYRVLCAKCRLHSHRACFLMTKERRIVNVAIHISIATEFTIHIYINLSRVQMTKPSDNFLLVQVTGCRFYTSDVLHLLVVIYGIVFAHSYCGTGSGFEFVKFERLHENVLLLLVIVLTVLRWFDETNIKSMFRKHCVVMF